MLMELFNKWKPEKCPRCGGKLEDVSSSNGRKTKRCTSCGEYNYQEISIFNEINEESATRGQFFEQNSESNQPNKNSDSKQKGKLMNKRAEQLIFLATPTGANSTIVYDNIRLVLNNCLDAVSAIKANKELKEEAVKKRLSNLYANALSTLEGYYVMSNACLTQAKSIAQSTINANSQNMGKDGDTIRQATTWRALETKTIHEIGNTCNWSPEFMGALIAAPPGVLNWDDLDKEFIVSKIKDKLPESYDAAVSEAHDIHSNVGAALITLAAEAQLPRNHRIWLEPDLVWEILFP